MAINFSENLNISHPSPTRTTDVVGVDVQGLPPSTYIAKESIPTYMRSLYMETKDNEGRRWTLKNQYDLNDWSPIPFPNSNPPTDGTYAIRQSGDRFFWESVGGGGGGTWGSITGTLSAQTDLQAALDNKQNLLGLGTAGQVLATNAGATGLEWIDTSGGGSWGSITGTISAQTDLQLALDDKADSTGNPSSRFEVSAGVGNSDAVNLLQLNTKVQTDVPAGAVFTDTQIDPQAGIGVFIDKTDPMAPVFRTELTIIDVYYEELRILKEAGDLIPGQHYKIVDFKSQWFMDNGYLETGTYSGSDDGLTYNFDNKIEPLYVLASTNEQINHVVKSATYPNHIIYYDAKWDWHEYGDLIRAKIADPQVEADWEIVKKEDLDPAWNNRGDYDASIDTPPTTGVAANDYWVVTGQGPFFTKTVKRDAPDQPKGTIYYRKDLELEVETGFDFVGYRVTRWAVTAPEYVGTKVYSRLETCSVPDSTDPTNRAKDALYISLKGTNTNHDPNISLNDGLWWATFRPAGEDTTGMYRDYVASDWTDSAGYPTEDMALSNMFGFNVVKDRFQNFPTFAFANDLTKDAAKGDDPYEKYYYCYVHNKGNLFLATGNTGYYENYFINLDRTVFGMSFVGQYMYQITINNMFGGTLKNYIFGASWNINIASSTAWFYNNYFEGFAFIEGIAVSSVSAVISRNVSIRKGAARNAHTGRSINGCEFTCSGTVFYMSDWIHANGSLHIEDSTIIGAGLKYNSEIVLQDSILDPGGSIQYSKIVSNMSHKFNTNVVIKGNILRTSLIDLKDVTIEGNLTDVTAANWDGVTIPSNVSFTDAIFVIPKWYGKNTWTGTAIDFKHVVVDKKYIDNPSTPTVEKLWYKQIDINGIETSVGVE